MLISFKRSQTSIVIRFKILDSSQTDGRGLTGLTEASAGLIVGTIADNEATTTRYRASSSEIETISTLGTYAAPTSGKCRFKEIDATNHKGVYELHLADARYAVSNAKSLLVSIAGATNCAETDFVVPLTDLNPYDAVRAGLTALPNANAEAAGGLFTRGTGAGQINQSANGQADVNVERLHNVAQSLLDLVDFADDGYDPSTNKVQGVVLVDTLTTYTNNTPQTGDSYARIGANGASLTALASAADLALAMTYIDTEIAAIKLVTDAIGTTGAGLTAIPWNAAWDAEVQSECVDALTAFGCSTVTTADVNAQVLDVLNVDTFAEIGQEAPSATQTIRKMLAYLYKAWRNRSTQTSSQYTLYADNATTVDQKAACSDDNVTYDRGEIGTGP